MSSTSGLKNRADHDDRATKVNDINIADTTHTADDFVMDDEADFFDDDAADFWNDMGDTNKEQDAIAEDDAQKTKTQYRIIMTTVVVMAFLIGVYYIFYRRSGQ